MENKIGNLPTEIESLHKLIASLHGKNQELLEQNNNWSSKYQQLSNQNTELSKKNTELLDRVNKLEEQLKLLKAKRFGKSSEKLERRIDIVERLLEEEESLLGFQTNSTTFIGDTIGEKSHAKRKKLPAHLPREEVVLMPEPKCDSCGGEEFRTIEEDISEVLEHIPETFKVIRYIRPRCTCIKCDNIMQAYAPSKVIDKGKAGPGLLAHIVVNKYCNHLPAYRQSQIYEREGVDLPRSTISGWLGGGAKLLEPLAKKIQEYIFKASQIHGDDTPVKVLEPGTGRTKTGRIWTYVRDGRPKGDEYPVAACYFYSPDRKGERPESHLKNFTGILHADSYAGYNGLYRSEDNPNAMIEEAACWAHSRRKFYDIIVSNDKANIALAIVEKIAKIYEIESQIRGLKPEQRLEVRRDKSKELVDELFVGLNKAYKQLPNKSSTSKAIKYALNNETALRRFLDNGNIEIDNNAAERALRAVAIGRKNWLFAGSDNGGNTAATFYTLIETAKLNNINPVKYLHKVFEVIQDYKANRIEDLLPWNVKLE